MECEMEMETTENTLPLPLPPPPKTEKDIVPTKRKVTLKLIENYALRKTCYKKRSAGLLKKMKELSILCGIPACSVIFGPGDTKPNVWPSPDIARQLLLRLEEVPEEVRSKKMVDRLAFMRQKTKKLEEQLARLKERNDEKEMLILMYQIHHDGKSLSDFEPSDINRLLGYVEQKLKQVRMRTGHFEDVLPPNPPPPPPHAYLSDVDMVLPQDNIGGFNNVSDSGVFPPSNFGDLIGEGDSGLEVLPQDNFEGFNSESDLLEMLLEGNYEGVNVENDSGSLPQGNFGGLNDENNLLEMLLEDNFEGLNAENDSRFLPQGNFGGHNVESGDLSWMLPEGDFGGLNVGNDSGVKVLPQGNFGGHNVESGDLSWVLPEGNFGGLNVENDSGVKVLPQGNFGGLSGESDLLERLPEGNFGDLNVRSDSKVLPQGNFTGLTGETNSGLQYGSSIDEIGGSDIWSSYGNFESIIGGSDGSYMEIEQHNENQGGSINDMGLWGHQNNFGSNSNEAAVGRLDANFFGTNNGNNLNSGLPTHGNLAGSGELLGSDIQVPTSFGGNFTGSY